MLAPTSLPHRLRRPLAVAACLIAVLGVLVGAGCERKPSYSQKTPDDVIASAIKMVKNNDAKHLSNLVYAEGPEMRVVLNRLGSLFEKLQLLAAQIQIRMPQEVADLKAEGMNAIAEQDPLGAFMDQVKRGPERTGGDVPNEGQRDVVQNALARFFADPYGWIDRNSSRLTTVKLADDVAAVMVDNQPILPPVGVTMRLDKDGKWYIALPTNLPVLSGYMPRTRDEWSIIASLVKVMENVAVELAEDVRTGKITKLKTLGDKAGDKAILPGLIAFAAYGKEMDARQRRDGITKTFKARLKDWAKQRGGEKEISAPLLKVFDAVAPDQIAKLARKSERTGISQMPDFDFTLLLQGWLKEANVKIDVASNVSGEEVDAVAQRWLDAEAAKKEAEAKAKREKKRK